MKNKIFQGEIEKGYKYFLPFPFVFTIIVNVFTFFMGLQYTPNTANSIVTYGVYLFYTLAMVYFFWKKRDFFLQKKILVATLCVAFFYGGAFLASFLQLGSSPYLIRTFFRFVVFVAPGFWFGLWTAVKKEEETFLDIIEKYSFIITFFALLYVITMGFGILYPGKSFPNMGMLNYMAVSYFTLPFFITVILQFIRNRQNKSLLLKRNITNLERGVIMVLYMVTLLTAGTRGTLFALLGGLFLSVLYFMTQNKKMGVKALLIFLVVTISVATVTFVHTPNLFRHMGRLKSFVENLEQGTFETGTPLKGRTQPVKKFVEPVGKAYKVDANNGQPYVIYEGKRAYLRERNTLYRLATDEIKANPLFGMAPLGYYHKYDTYPHNAIYEALSELGIPLALLWIGAYIFMTLKLLFRSRKRLSVGLMGLFLVTMSAKYLFSSTLWVAPELMFFAGYALFVRGGKENG